MATRTDIKPGDKVTFTPDPNGHRPREEGTLEFIGEFNCIVVDAAGVRRSLSPNNPRAA